MTEEKKEIDQTTEELKALLDMKKLEDLRNLEDSSSMRYKDRYAQYVSWEPGHGKDFSDLLLPTHALANLLNKGALDQNVAAARPYIEKLIELRGVGEGFDKKFEISFKGYEAVPSTEDWENEVEVREKFVEYLVDNTPIEEMKKKMEEVERKSDEYKEKLEKKFDIDQNKLSKEGDKDD